MDEVFLSNLSRKMYPEPGKEQKELSNKLTRHIKAKIKARGNISFSEYMNMALYTPELGYYANRFINIGQTGDFVTAPEISRLFGATLANYIKREYKTPPAMLEFGGGSGKLARDILEHLGEQEYSVPNYYILEPSPYLRRAQQELVGDKVVWIDKLPRNFKGIIIANEVVDALPFDRFIILDGKIFKLLVNRHLQWVLGDEDDIPLPFNLQDYPQKYVFEQRKPVKPWLKSISGILAAGEVIIIDYGYENFEYYSTERAEGTMMCFMRHYKGDDPFVFPGLQDITAQVNFSELINFARGFGLQLKGFYSQAEFLLANGVLDIAQENFSPDLTAQVQMSRQIQQLTMPGQMGEIFKVAIFLLNA